MPTVAPSAAIAGPSPLPALVPLANDPAELDCPTRQRILRLVVEEGPVSVVRARAGPRPHRPRASAVTSAALEAHGQIVVHAGAGPGACRPGPPGPPLRGHGRGQAALTRAYSDLAGAGPGLPRAGGRRRGGPGASPTSASAELAERHAAPSRPPGTTSATVSTALADRRSPPTATPPRRDRCPAAGPSSCARGTAPSRHVAARFPQLCEAETRAFSRLLGVHVQRLSTLAAGGHVCTTHIPTPCPTSATATQRRDSGRNTMTAPTETVTRPPSTDGDHRLDRQLRLRLARHRRRRA